MTDHEWGGRLREEALRALFDANPDAVYVFDLNGTFLAGNAALLERTQLDWPELASMRFDPTVHPDDLPRVREEFARAAAGERRRFRARGVRPDGSSFHADILTTPIVIDGRVEAVLGVARDIDELAGTRESLDISEGLLHIASRVGRVAGWASDVRTGRIHWSDELLHMLGLPGGDTIDVADVLSVFAEPDRARISDAYLLCASDGVPMDLRLDIERDGETLYAKLTAEAVRDSDGRIRRVEGVLRDVTTGVTAKLAQQKLERMLFDAFDGIDVALVLIDADRRVRFINQTAMQQLGRERKDLLGQDYMTLGPPPAEVRALVESAMSDGRLATMRRYEEQLGWLETTVFPAGDLFGIQTRDVTELEQARRRHDDDARRIYSQQSALNQAPDALISRGLGGAVERWNRSAGALLGVGDEDLTGRPLRDVLGLDPATDADIEAELARSGTWRGDLIIRRPDGSERLTECRWQVLVDADGAPDSVFCLLVDVTDRRREEEILARTQRMESIGTLAGGISHDLNNVLTPLMLSIQLLAAGENDPARVKIFDGMLRTVERGSAMIRQVLTFARGVEGDRTVVDIDELAQGFRAFCRDTLPKNISVDIDVRPGMRVMGDSTQLLQVLMNLATNARDAMPDGGRLALSGWLVDDRVMLEVADEGAGMEPAVAIRVFEPFYTTKQPGRGTGLGLAVCQAIARSHGGTLEVRSSRGEGATFRLTLPTVAEAIAAPTEAPERVPTDLSSVEVLVVDDEDAIIDVATMVIAEEGGHAVGASSTEDAQQLLAAGRFDVVLTDLVMPGTTGREFLTWLAENHPELPVVTMSGIPEQGGAAATRVNVVETLDKPFTFDQLVQAIDRARSARR